MTDIDFKCPLCGCQKYGSVHIMSIIFTFYQCSSCSLMFGDPENISRVDVASLVKHAEREKEQSFWQDEKDSDRR